MSDPAKTTTMTLRQWATLLGDAIPLADIVEETGLPAIELARAIRRGRIVVREFRAHDGRVFRMVRRKDLERYAAQRPRITLEGMQRAFAKMAGDTPQPTSATARTDHTDPNAPTTPPAANSSAAPTAGPTPERSAA